MNTLGDPVTITGTVTKGVPVSPTFAAAAIIFSCVLFIGENIPG
jgi:hypothetical protein